MKDADIEPPSPARRSFARLLPFLIPAGAAATAAWAAGAVAAPSSPGIPWRWVLPGWIVGLLGSAFFAILDHAVFALDSEEIEALERNHPARARRVKAARKDVDRTWFTLLSGVLFFHLVFAFSTGVMVWRLLGAEGFAAGTAAVMASVAAVLILGEIAPCLLAARWLRSLAPFAARFSAAAAPFLLPFSAPPLLLLRLYSRYLGLRADERPRTIEVEKRLLALIGFGQVDVSLEEEEREMIDHALEFGESRARDIMTPRNRIAAVETSLPQQEMRDVLRGSACSRLVVYENTPDHVVGVLHRKQVLLNPETDYHEMVMPAVFVPEDMELIEILALMKRRRCQIVVVLDKYGATVGVISMDDLLQALVGPAAEEEKTDEGEVSRPFPPKQKEQTP